MYACNSLANCGCCVYTPVMNYVFKTNSWAEAICIVGTELFAGDEWSTAGDAKPRAIAAQGHMSGAAAPAFGPLVQFVTVRNTRPVTGSDSKDSPGVRMSGMVTH